MWLRRGFARSGHFDRLTAEGLVRYLPGTLLERLMFLAGAQQGGGTLVAGSVLQVERLRLTGRQLCRGSSLRRRAARAPRGFYLSLWQLFAAHTASARSASG